MKSNRILKTAGLIGLVGALMIPIFSIPVPQHWKRVPGSTVFQKYVIDEDGDQEADKTFIASFGPRFQYLEVREPTEKEKKFYKEDK